MHIAGVPVDNKSPNLLRYYPDDRLFTDETRERFIEPDLDELPAQNGSGSE